MFSSNVVLHIIGNAFSGVLVNATAPYEMTILTDQKQFPLAVSITTLLGSVAGMIVPMLLAAVKIAPGHDSFMAGIAVSVVTADVLFITRFGSRVEKQQSNEKGED